MSTNETVQPQDENAEEEANLEGTEEAETEENDAEGEEQEASKADEAETEPKSPEQKTDEGKPNRPVYSMPVAKAQKEKKVAVEKAKREAEEAAKAEIERIRQEYEGKLKNAGVTDADSAIRDVATKHGLNPDAALELANAIKSTVKLPNAERLDSILREAEINEEKAKLLRQFDERVLPLIKKDFPGATPDFIDGVKAEIGSLAFTEGYNSYRVEDIYLVKKDKFNFKNGKGAESPQGHGTQTSSFKVLSDEDEIKLANTDPDTYKRYLGWLQGQESRYLS